MKRSKVAWPLFLSTLEREVSQIFKSNAAFKLIVVDHDNHVVMKTAVVLSLLRW